VHKCGKSFIFFNKTFSGKPTRYLTKYSLNNPFRINYILILIQIFLRFSRYPLGSENYTNPCKSITLCTFQTRMFFILRQIPFIPRQMSLSLISTRNRKSMILSFSSFPNFVFKYPSFRVQMSLSLLPTCLSKTGFSSRIKFLFHEFFGNFSPRFSD